LRKQSAGKKDDPLRGGEETKKRNRETSLPKRKEKGGEVYQIQIQKKETQCVVYILKEKKEHR